MELLKSLNAAQIIRSEEPYLWDFCDLSLQLDSRMALACVEENKAYELIRSYRIYADEPNALIDFMK